METDLRGPLRGFTTTASHTSSSSSFSEEKSFSSSGTWTRFGLSKVVGGGVGVRDIGKLATSRLTESERIEPKG